MTATPFVVWQISGGPASRAYADVFLRQSVALIGPGDAVQSEPQRDDEFEDSFVRCFAPVAYANLARLKQPAAYLFARMQRP